jgi:hypothetical protein
MRLMLGRNDTPSLLVNVDQEHSPTHFEFWVVNGAWAGTFNNGYITIWGCPSGDYSSLDKVQILTDNQDRLRCGIGDYQEVFNNFSDLDYIAIKPKVVKFDDMDDDIPF